MKHRQFSIVMLVALLAALFTVPTAALANEANFPARPVVSQSDPAWQDFVGKRFAVITGSIFEATVRTQFTPTEVLYFSDYPSLLEALTNDKVDGAIRGYTTARLILMDERYQSLDMLKLEGDQWALPYGAISMNPQIIDEFNSFLESLRADGTLDDMAERWLENYDPTAQPPMPDIPLTGENGTYIVGISSSFEPFSYLGNDGVKLGFDIELAKRFAASQGKDIRFEDMAYTALLPYVISGKADFGISDILYTPERAESVLFTDPYYIDPTGLIYKPAATSDTETAVATGGFSDWLHQAVQRNLIQDNRWKLILDGLGVTLIIALAAQVLGTALGAGLCYLLTRRSRIVRRFGTAYCALIHGTPMVVLLMVAYYVIFGSSTISNVLVAILAFTAVTAATVAETLRSGIESVDTTEIEAVRALGFSAFRTFLTVTLPQAIRQALPIYLNGFVELVKATAIVGYIAIMDLTRAGDLIRSRTYDAYFPLLLVAFVYLIVTTLLVLLFKWILRRLRLGAVA